MATEGKTTGPTGSRFLAYAKEHGGQAYVAPTDVFFSDTNVVEPDVLFVTAGHEAKMEKTFIRDAPDIVWRSLPRRRGAWSSTGRRSSTRGSGSPSTGTWTSTPTTSRSTDWPEGPIRPPEVLERAGVLTIRLLSGFQVPVDEILGSPED